MRVWREICGEMVLDMPAVQFEGGQPLGAQIFSEQFRIAQKKEGPDPREGAESHLKTACPVYSDRIWILLVPVLPLNEDFTGESRLPREPISFGERDKMLVAIQLPCDLRISDFFEIEVSDFEPRFARSLLTVYEFAVPVDFRAVVETLVTEQIETVGANTFRSKNNFLD